MAAPQTQEDLMKLAHDDPRYIIERGFWVVDKQKNPVPFLFNDPQNFFYDERTTRDDILKAGQLGLSTEIEAILTVKFLLVPNAWCVTVSHEDEATRRLFEKVQYYLDHLPPWLQPFYRPGKTTEKGIANEVMNSRYYIGTAGAHAFGRGDAIHYAHLSESSRWRDAGRVMTGILRAVPLNDPHTWIVKETTANGVGNLHHIEYQRAKQGKSEFKHHFLPWFCNPNYRVPDAKISEQSLNDEEQRLLRRFSIGDAHRNKGYINMEALAWRRQMIGTLVSEDGRTPEEMFKQEFPCDDLEAFLFSGNPIFPVEQLEEYKVAAKLPAFVGNLVGVAPNENLDETDHGWLKLWDFPTIDGQYIIFADVGQFTDFCSAHVVDKKTWKTVAHFHANIKAFNFGDELFRLGFFFNKALIAVEVNNMGQSTIDRLVSMSYPSLYMRERLNQKDKTQSKEFGWYTNDQTKSRMIGYLQDLTRTKQADIPDIDTIGEMTTYIKHEDGSMGASKGNHDDRVISQAGVYYILKLHPFVASKIQRTTVVEKKVSKFKAFRTGVGKRTFRSRFR